MVKWKIIRIWVVEAPTRTDALNKYHEAVQNDKEDRFFEVEIVKRIDEESGWVGGFLKQLRGK